MPKRTFKGLSKKRKKQILKVSVGFFASHGYARTSIKMIRSRLRVADGYLHYYFKNKQDLGQWVIVEGMKLLQSHYQEHVAPKEPEGVSELFRICVLELTRFAQEHREFCSAYLRFINEPDFPLSTWMSKQGAWILLLFKKEIESGVARGELRSDVPPETTILALGAVNRRLQERCFQSSRKAAADSKSREMELPKLVDSVIALFEKGYKS